MKFNLFCLFIITSFTACQKEIEGGGSSGSDKYLTLTPNSTWVYKTNDNSGAVPDSTTFTVTSTARDTMIAGKKYHIFTVSTGGNQYSTVSGNDYFQYDSLPFAGTAIVIDRLYLKDNVAVNTSWIQNTTLTFPNVPLPVPFIITNTITEKGISRTVNNISYTDVIHVKTMITSSVIPATSFTNESNSYYAKKFGLIENTTVLKLNFLGIVQNVDVKTILISSDLK